MEILRDPLSEEDVAAWQTHRQQGVHSRIVERTQGLSVEVETRVTTPTAWRSRAAVVALAMALPLLVVGFVVVNQQRGTDVATAPTSAEPSPPAANPGPIELTLSTEGHLWSGSGPSLSTAVSDFAAAAFNWDSSEFVVAGDLDASGPVWLALDRQGVVADVLFVPHQLPIEEWRVMQVSQAPALRFVGGSTGPWAITIGDIPPGYESAIVSVASISGTVKLVTSDPVDETGSLNVPLQTAPLGALIVFLGPEETLIGAVGAHGGSLPTE